MTPRESRKLFVCYVPGLDSRRITPEQTPFISQSMGFNPWAAISTLPNTELLPTLITGVYPHEHGIWQVRLKPDAERLQRRRILDRAPDFLSTTFQCLWKLFEPSYDLTAIPARRRRCFELFRFKYERRRMDPNASLGKIGPYESIFGILGDDSKYYFTKSFDKLGSLLSQLPSGGPRLEFLEMYALDLLQHWNLDREETMRSAYQATDEFVRRLHENCQRRAVTLMLLVDHGQEPVVGAIPLAKELRRSGIPEEEFRYFMEVAQARFWFHTERARRRITDLLGTVGHTTVLGYKDLHRYHIGFEDEAYGELYLIAEPGFIFFPHDFYHPLGNLFLGLTDRHQRSRIFQPRHRGNHGYLPEHPSEKGFAILFDRDSTSIRPEIELIDFAPSVLAFLGVPKPQYMKGTHAFRE